MSVYVARFKFLKKDEFKYLSHLDILALMERALMRTGFPLVYSGGFHPKPRLSFSNPIPLGVQSLAEYCDVELLEGIPSEDFIRLLNLKLPDNLKITEALIFEKNPLNKIPSLMSAIDIVIYEYELFKEKQSNPEHAVKKVSGKTPFEEKSAAGNFFSFDDFKSSFLKELGNLFDQALKKEETETDLFKVKNSIYDYEVYKPVREENVFFLKVMGYAKILKSRNNSIFKFNVFNDYLKKFLETAGIEIVQVQKTATYIFRDNILTDPIKSLAAGP